MGSLPFVPDQMLVSKASTRQSSIHRLATSGCPLQSGTLPHRALLPPTTAHPDEHAGPVHLLPVLRERPRAGHPRPHGLRLLPTLPHHVPGHPDTVIHGPSLASLQPTCSPGLPPDIRHGEGRMTDTNPGPRLPNIRRARIRGSRTAHFHCATSVL